MSDVETRIIQEVSIFHFPMNFFLCLNELFIDIGLFILQCFTEIYLILNYITLYQSTLKATYS
jgi:hypothetical protein